jgi:hypothetical protein
MQQTCRFLLVDILFQDGIQGKARFLLKAFHGKPQAHAEYRVNMRRDL